MKKLFRGKVEKGKIILDDQRSFDLLAWSLNNKEIEMTLAKRTKRRSTQQNKYYWGVVLNILSEYTGHTSEELHDSMRAMFLLDNSGKMPIVKRTRGLHTVEFEEYLTKIRMFASTELGCYIPEPNEVEAL